MTLALMLMIAHRQEYGDLRLGPHLNPNLNMNLNLNLDVIAIAGTPHRAAKVQLNIWSRQLQKQSNRAAPPIARLANADH